MDSALAGAVVDFLLKVGGALGLVGGGMLYQRKADDDADDKKTAADLAKVQEVDAASKADSMADAKAYLKKQGLLK